MTFALSPHGWWSGQAQPSTVQRAHEWAEGIARGRFEREGRYLGKIGEWGVRLWLRERGVPFTAHGERDLLPDVTVADVGYDVKTGTRRVRFDPDWEIGINAAQMHDHVPSQGRMTLLCVFLTEHRRLLICGTTTLDHVRSCRFVRRGEPLGDGSRQAGRAETDMWCVPAVDLTPADVWLQTLGGSA